MGCRKLKTWKLSTNSGSVNNCPTGHGPFLPSPLWTSVSPEDWLSPPWGFNVHVNQTCKLCYSRSGAVESEIHHFHQPL